MYSLTPFLAWPVWLRAKVRKADSQLLLPDVAYLALHLFWATLIYLPKVF